VNIAILASPDAFPNSGMVQKRSSGSWLLLPFLEGLDLPFPLLRTCNLEFHLELLREALSLDELSSRMTLYSTMLRPIGANGLDISIGGSVTYKLCVWTYAPCADIPVNVFGVGTAA
jgi:hypothetical protein